MKKINFSLQAKITILIITVIFISLSSAAALVSKWAVHNVQDKVETNIMNVAEIVANTTSIVNALDDKDPNGIIRRQVDRMLNSTEQIDFIVVADMNGIRHSHPIHERIGKKFVGGDEKRVRTKGDTYISEAVGTLGRSLRAFVPIYNSENRQTGFVVVGTLAKSIDKAKNQGMLTIILSSFFGLLIGIIGAFLLSLNIKRDLLGFEPNQIAQLYMEKKGMLEAIHEGIIAIDEHDIITLCNDSAKTILKIKDDDIIGKNILDVFPKSKLPEVLKSGNAEYDKERRMKDTLILANRVPIKNGEKTIGAIATFRDKTMMTKLAEEITGVKQIIEALRANTHEFMNKLHVILGLIQLGDLDEAKKYIVDITDNQHQIMSTVTSRIKDSTVAALLLGKISRAKELGIEMIIDDHTILKNNHGVIRSNALVTILGNLIENALEATSKTNKDEKKVFLTVIEDLSQINIVIKDTGVGIKKEHLPLILNRGFTTKMGSRGVGLSLVMGAIESLGGNIDIHSEVSKGTTITVVLKKGDNND